MAISRCTYVVNDTVYEPDETFRLQLVNSTGGGIVGALGQALVTITDDGDAGTLSFSAATCVLGEDKRSMLCLGTVLEQQFKLGGSVKRPALAAAASEAAESALSTMEQFSTQAQENLKVAMEKLQQAQQELSYTQNAVRGRVREDAGETRFGRMRARRAMDVDFKGLLRDLDLRRRGDAWQFHAVRTW